jgi:hypothetical protein
MQFITLFAAAVLALPTTQTTEPTPEPILGALSFYKEECGSQVLPVDNEFEDIQLGVTVPIKNTSDIKSIYWSYPSKQLKVEFFTKDSQTPYATVTGTQEGFAGYVCKDWTTRFQVFATKSDQAGFLKPDSYYIVSKIIQQ